MQKTAYDTATGEILYLVEGTPNSPVIPPEPGIDFVDGVGDAATEKVVGGQIVAKSQAELDADLQSKLPALINAERDRRLVLPLPFDGYLFDFDRESRDRISGMAALAGFAIAAGAQPGNLLWHGESEPFAWITYGDNQIVTMDAQTMFAFGKAAAARVARVVFKARALKDMQPIPTDITNVAYWEDDP